MAVSESSFSPVRSRLPVAIGGCAAFLGCFIPLIHIKDLPPEAVAATALWHTGNSGVFIALVVAVLGAAPWITRMTRPSALAAFAAPAALLGVFAVVGVAVTVGGSLIASELGQPAGALALDTGWFLVAGGCALMCAGYARGLVSSGTDSVAVVRPSNDKIILIFIGLLVVGGGYYAFNTFLAAHPSQTAVTPQSVAQQPGVVPVATPAQAAVSVPAPVQSGSADRIAAVENFYSDWNAKRLAAAYALLSRGYQAAHPFASWSRSHASVLSISVDASDIPGTTKVRVYISSTDPGPSYGSVQSNYSGSWGLVLENGGWRLDNPQLNQI